MTNDRVLEVLKEAEVLLEGHFLLTSGRHSNRYMQCAKIFQYTKYSEELCAALAEKFAHAGVELVIGPAIGAIQMAYEVSRALGVKNIFAERDSEGVMALRRSFTIEPGQKVLIVEDVVTTGGSVKEVIEIVKALGGEVVGIGAIVDRSAGKVDFGARFESVLSIEIQSFDAKECPMCKEGSAVVKPGSRKIS
ncbi:MAG: orotate phosphoribosyltransferase [Hyphomonadaceae bacterium]|nr:orotate phosphoribosyltransferase [Clostridia bacterium]